MKASDLSLRDLEYLVTAAALLHFGKAASACHVSQPALSLQIKKIEAQLGYAVFERRRRTVLVTPRGEKVVAQARLVMEQAEKIFHISGENSAPFVEPFGISSIATLGPYLLPHLLGPLRKKYPEGKFLFREGLTDELLANLKAGETDVVLAAATFETSHFEVEPLFFEPFLLAAAKGHELTTKTPLTTKDLHSENMVLLEDGHCLSDQTLALCARRGKKEPVFHATSMETLRHLVAGGMGYTLFPALAAEIKNNVKEIITYRPFIPPVGRKIILVYRRGFPRKPEAQRLADFIRAQVKALAPSGITSASR